LTMPIVEGSSGDPRLTFGARETQQQAIHKPPRHSPIESMAEEAYAAKMTAAYKIPDQARDFYVSTDPRRLPVYNYQTTVQDFHPPMAPADIAQHRTRNKTSSSLVHGATPVARGDSQPEDLRIPPLEGGTILHTNKHLYIRDSDGSRRILEVNGSNTEERADKNLPSHEYWKPPPQRFDFVTGGKKTTNQRNFEDTLMKGINEQAIKDSSQMLRNPLAPGMDQAHVRKSHCMDYSQGIPTFDDKKPLVGGQQAPKYGRRSTPPAYDQAPQDPYDLGLHQSKSQFFPDSMYSQSANSIGEFFTEGNEVKPMQPVSRVSQ